jgi:hypothetical protein
VRINGLSQESNGKGETKMSFNTLKKSFLLLLFLFLPLTVFAQSIKMQTVALIPFWGSNPQIIQEFGEELYKGVNDMSGFRSAVIDMNNLPEDVPEGGFPPYICPSPSLTKTHPLALTGEMTPDPDDEEFWHLRLYLWEMGDTRLVFSDELTAYDRNDCAIALPGMLEWLFSWLTKGGASSGTGGVSVPGPDSGFGTAREVFITTSMPLHWMYIGGRGGLTPLRMQAEPGWEDPDTRHVANHWQTMNAALSFTASLAPESVPFFSRFAAQIEGVLNYDWAPITVMTISPGALLKFQAYRQGNMLFSLFGGAYTSMLLSDTIAYDSAFPIGLHFGLSFGAKLDPLPGIFFIDMRFSMDMFNTYVRADDEGYKRRSVTISFGYEYGVITKK